MQYLPVKNYQSTSHYFFTVAKRTNPGMPAAVLTLSVFEITLLLFGAIVLGITIHFFISTKKSWNQQTVDSGKNDLAKDEWKLRYFDDVEAKDKEISSLKTQLQQSKTETQDAKENEAIYSIEAEEMNIQNRKLKSELETLKSGDLSNNEHVKTINELRSQNKQLQSELELAQQSPSDYTEHPDYLQQLMLAQKNLQDHDKKINILLDNIEIIKQKEELAVEITLLKKDLDEKDKELLHVNQHQQVAKEMTSRLDNAYTEFNSLQNKLKNMEAQVTASKMMSLEFEDLKEVNSKLARDHDDQKQKAQLTVIENQQLHNRLVEAEDKYRESNFQRQQLQKRVAYLEELNHDLQVVSEVNQKLEGQLKKIGELESQLHDDIPTIGRASGE